MAWDQLEMETPHIAYACVGIFCTIFSLVSLFVKERLYIGEATVATIAGLILGPHCLNWFSPVEWGNSDFITLEICRIVLCIQIIAVAVELPKKYMRKHWLSVFVFLVPVMTTGWLIVGLFIWCLIPHFSFNDGLLVSACVTATDPVLAAAVVGKGKFAERVPGHLRNLLSAESGCNDGMAFPFIYLSLYLITYSGRAGEIVKNWFCITILWECFFGCLLGAVLGFVLRKLVAFAEEKNLIDRESFLAIFVFLAFNCAGIGSMLGVDDLLMSFAAGTAFGWNGDFAKKTEESHVSTVIDLLLNLSFFVYFGAIIPWPQFNDVRIGLNVWRLIVLALVIIFLRRLPAVIILKPIVPDVKTWREAIFCGHFGPIGVGAIFASILARKDLESHYTDEETPLDHLPNDDFPHYLLLASIWPIVCFIVVTSIIVHGSSVAVLTLGKRLNRMAITMTYTRTNTTQGDSGGSNWIQRLQGLDKNNTPFSLQRVDTMAPTEKQEVKDGEQQGVAVPETSGVKVRPAGGMTRRKKKKSRRRQKQNIIQKTLSRVRSGDDNDDYYNNNDGEGEARQGRYRPANEILQLGGGGNNAAKSGASTEPDTSTSEVKNSSSSSSTGDKHLAVPGDAQHDGFTSEVISPEKVSGRSEYGQNSGATKDKISIPTTAYQDGDKLIVEDQHGEVMDDLKLEKEPPKKKHKRMHGGEDSEDEQHSIHSMGSLQRHLSSYSRGSTEDESDSEASSEKQNKKKKKPKLPGVPLGRKISDSLSRKASSRRSYYKKDDPAKRKVFAHRVDNLILIENADGEIIRRYKVNRQASNLPGSSANANANANANTKTAGRSRSSTLLGMMKSMVGIKSDKSPQPPAEDQPVPSVHVTDLEQGTHHSILVPQHDEHPISHTFDKVEDKVAGILEKKHESGDHHLMRQASPPPPVHGDEEYDDDDDDDVEEDVADLGDDDDDDDDEDDVIGSGRGANDDEETPAEKKRRLQALGHLPNTNRDAHDEE
ncbi:uncharacterized protein LODBEIA_P49420 [Lodderomyces beijingensis]|uniref:Na+/H+ antiporter n=1 Tax=Lodderomyces beijingensis TaxID=1775926 RepID=A0ABP0ZRC7_9ASCO